jgi:deazaflavin-dependent oxidoreductase (nitroreductase family)
VVSAGFRAEYRCASQLLRRCQCVASDDARFRCHEGGAAPFRPDGTPPRPASQQAHRRQARTFAGIAAGLPSVILTTTGAKSGKPRTVALLGIPHPDGVAVVAANYGGAKHPAWYHNLKANPAATVTIEGDVWDATARLATLAERDEIWTKGVKIYGDLTGHHVGRESTLVTSDDRTVDHRCVNLCRNA